MILFLDCHPILPAASDLTLEISHFSVSCISRTCFPFPCCSITTPFLLLSSRTKIRFRVLITTTRLLYIYNDSFFPSHFRGDFRPSLSRHRPLLSYVLPLSLAPLLAHERCRFHVQLDKLVSCMVCSQDVASRKNTCKHLRLGNH